MPRLGFQACAFFTKCLFLCISCILYCSHPAQAQGNKPQKDTTLTLSLSDTTQQRSDTLLDNDSNALPLSKDALTSAVNYSFDDSSYFDMEKKEFHLWGKAHVDYEKVKLNAGYIKINFGNNTVSAEPSLDSVGQLIDRPVFNDGDRDYVCDKMIYNIQTKKGKIYGLVTSEGDGIIHGEQVKKDSADNLYVKEARYSTCTDTLHPHFYILAKKLMIIPGKQIVSGPAQLYVADVPSPVILPFGFFPLKKGQRRGILAPSFANSRAQGYYIKGLGYYFPINDYLDLAVKGDIYFNGSWQASVAQQYKKNYRFSGSYSITYGNLVFGDRKAEGDFSRTRNFNLNWRHIIDPKRIPGYTFNLDINLSSANYYQTSTSYNYNDITKNIVRSSVNLGKSDRKNRYNITAALNHDQNLQTHDINLVLPEINFTYNSFAPFMKKNNVGTPKFYENIRIGYTMNFKNQISTKDTILTRNPDTISQLLKNGMIHRVPLNLPTFKILKYFNFAPTADYQEYWYFKTVEKNWDAAKNKLDTTYNHNFKRAYSYGGQVSITTAIYGMMHVNRLGLVAVSHIIRPSISFGYRPDFSDPKFGFYKYNRPDSTQLYPGKYSIFEQGIYGSPGAGEQGFMSVSINNNLEAKVKHKTDTGFIDKKVSLIDNLTIGASYNFLADSFKMSMISFSGATKLFKKLAVTFGGVIDPYQYNSTQRIDAYNIDVRNLKLGTLTRTNIAFSTSFSSNDLKNKPNKTKAAKDSSAEKRYIDAHPDLFVDFDIPWNLNLSYTFDYNYNPLISREQQTRFQPRLMVSGDVKLTAKWQIGFSTGYDFHLKQIAFTNINLIRDLHCWTMKFDWVPTGQYRRYMFTLVAKSTLLQDLKLNKRREWFDK